MLHIRLLAVLSGVAVLTACAVDDNVPDPPVDDDDVADDDTGINHDGTVAGWVEDPAGEPLAGIGVTFCADICFSKQTGEDGAFEFEFIKPGEWVLQNLSYPGEDQVTAILGHTKCFDFVSVEQEHQQIELEWPCVIHPIEPSELQAGEQTVELSGGLLVTFDADLLGTDDNPLPYPAEELRLGAVEIPPQHWPRGGLEGWTILRAWALAIWDLNIENGFTVTAPLDVAEPLAPDTPVAFLVADYYYGAANGIFFYEEAQLEPDGRTIATPPGGGLDRATLWMAVAQLEP